MKQPPKNIKPEFNYPQELDFIFEATGVAILVEDITRNIQLTNNLFCHLFHLNAKPNSLLNTNSIVLLNEISKNFNDSKKFETAFTEIPKTGDIVTNQLWKLENGKTILQDYSPLYKDNTLKGHIWVYKEYQNLQNENLIYSNFQLENALHFLPNEIAIYNTNLQIVYVNKSYINSDEKRLWAKGKTLQQYFSYENLSQEIALERERNVAKTFTSKMPISWQEKNTKDNTFYLRTCYPIIDSNKKIKSVIEHTVNITLQKKLEEKLQLSVEHFYKVVNSVNEVVLQTDGKLQLQFLNEYWHSLTGQDNNDFFGKSIFV